MEKHTIFMESSTGSIVFLAGEAGMGKSVIVDYFGGISYPHVPKLQVNANRFSMTTPYFLWNALLPSIIGYLQEGTDKQFTQQEFLLTLIPEDKIILCPVLNGIGGFQFEENHITKSLTGLNRSQAMKELFLLILSGSGKLKRICFILVLNWCIFIDIFRRMFNGWIQQVGLFYLIFCNIFQVCHFCSSTNQQKCFSG
jgi:hypothetical protein